MITPTSAEMGKKIVAIAKRNKRGPSTTMRIRATRHPVGTVHVYEITGEELSVIDNSNFLRTFYTFLCGSAVSVAASFGTCLSTVPLANPKTFAVFSAIIIVGSLASFVFGVLWLRMEWQLWAARRQLKETLT